MVLATCCRLGPRQQDRRDQPQRMGMTSVSCEPAARQLRARRGRGRGLESERKNTTLRRSGRAAPLCSALLVLLRSLSRRLSQAEGRVAVLLLSHSSSFRLSALSLSLPPSPSLHESHLYSIATLGDAGRSCSPAARSRRSERRRQQNTTECLSVRVVLLWATSC